MNLLQITIENYGRKFEIFANFFVRNTCSGIKSRDIGVRSGIRRENGKMGNDPKEERQKLVLWIGLNVLVVAHLARIDVCNKYSH